MRRTFRNAVAAVLMQHAGEWVHWAELAKAGGAMAWRTRISEARRELGMAIENKITQRPDKTKDSFYRYIPGRLF
jgi:carboxylesterase type B